MRLSGVSRVINVENFGGMWKISKNANIQCAANTHGYWLCEPLTSYKWKFFGDVINVSFWRHKRGEFYRFHVINVWISRHICGKFDVMNVENSRHKRGEFWPSDVINVSFHVINVENFVRKPSIYAGSRGSKYINKYIMLFFFNIKQQQQKGETTLAGGRCCRCHHKGIFFRSGAKM